MHDLSWLSEELARAANLLAFYVFTGIFESKCNVPPNDEIMPFSREIFDCSVKQTQMLHHKTAGIQHIGIINLSLPNIYGLK